MPTKRIARREWRSPRNPHTGEKIM